jgi:transposase-like protein
MENKTTFSTSEKMFELIKLCERSGMNNKTFCEQHGIGQAMFYYWKKKYIQSQSTHEGKFVPVRIKDSQVQTGEIEICYPNGVRLKLSQGIDLSIIRSFIGLL